MNVYILAFYKNERVLADSKSALRVIGSSTLRKGSLQIANLFLTQWDTETTRYDAKLPNAFQLIPVPIHWQLALFPVSKRDPKLARVAEVVASILCSSYWCPQLGCHRPQPIDPDPDFRTTMSCGGVTVV